MTTSPKQFTVFSNDVDVLTAGGMPYTNLTSHYFFDRVGDHYDFSRISEERMRTYVKSGFPSPLTLDVEAWPLNDSTRSFLFDQMSLAVNTIRDIDPTYRLGWYRYLPIRDYWTPVQYAGNPLGWGDHMRTWRHQNETNIDLFGPLFDFLAPSLYTFRNHLEDWKIYAEYNLREAAYAKKQVYAFVMPVFHGNHQPVPDDLWRGQIAFLQGHPQCHGIFVFPFTAQHDWQTPLIETMTIQETV